MLHLSCNSNDLFSVHGRMQRPSIAASKRICHAQKDIHHVWVE